VLGEPGRLKGCFEVGGKDSTVVRGRIKIKPFAIKIKSLNSSFEYSESINAIHQIEKLVKFFKG
jgi:hypothetical protein